MKVAPPLDKQSLLQNANELTGITLQQLATSFNVAIPASTTHAKGWVGQLLETALGAEASSRAAPDFLNLGIELKTIPLNKEGKAKESTYVCVVQLEPNALKDWDTSLVKHKLSEVLWIPIEAAKDIPFNLRRIGTPTLWRPTAAQEKQLKQDWQELSDLISLGELDKVSANMGEYLQIRPKAANAKALTSDKNQAGQKTLPRGFYLRPIFTNAIISSVK